MKNLTLKNSNEKIQLNNIICVGRNYAAHAEELGNEVPEFPLIFLKPTSALIYSGDNISMPEYSNELHHEIELVLLIGTTIKNAGLTEAENAIIGYAVGLDMTLRDLQSKLKEKGHPWTLAKGFDTSAVVSDFVLKKDYLLNNTESISLKVNNELRQDSNLSLMLFKPAEIVKYLSSKMTLSKGDIIFTGTPKGVGKVEKGEELFGTIENVGEVFTQIE